MSNSVSLVSELAIDSEVAGCMMADVLISGFGLRRSVDVDLIIPASACSRRGALDISSSASESSSESPISIYIFTDRSIESIKFQHKMNSKAQRIDCRCLTSITTIFDPLPALVN